MLTSRKCSRVGKRINSQSWKRKINNVQMGLDVLSELQLRSRGANGWSHTSLLYTVPPSNWGTWFGGSRWLNCGLTQKKTHWKSDDKIGPSEEEGKFCSFKHPNFQIHQLSFEIAKWFSRSSNRYGAQLTSLSVVESVYLSKSQLCTSLILSRF